MTPEEFEAVVIGCEAQIAVAEAFQERFRLLGVTEGANHWQVLLDVGREVGLTGDEFWKLSVPQSLRMLDAYIETRPGIATMRAMVEGAVAATAPPSSMPCYVTLDQMAASVQASKKTLRRRRKPSLPKPDIKGKTGQADRWEWRKARTWLMEQFNRLLPEKFPADLFKG